MRKLLSRSRRRRYPRKPIRIQPPEPVKIRYTIIHDVSGRVVSAWETQLEGKVSLPVKVVHLEGKITNELITELRGKLGRIYESLAGGEVAIDKEYTVELLQRVYRLWQLRRQIEQRGELKRENRELKEELVRLKEELEKASENRNYRKRTIRVRRGGNQ